MDWLYLLIAAFVIFYIFKAYKKPKKNESNLPPVDEWHHINPISQRFDSRGLNTSYVYFIKESGKHHIKIGKADDPEQRKKELSTGTPHHHEIVHLIKSETAYKTEKLFHRYFSEKRLTGEWFDLSEKELRWIQRGDYPREIEDSIKGY